MDTPEDMVSYMLVELEMADRTAQPAALETHSLYARDAASRLYMPPEAEDGMQRQTVDLQ